MRGRDPRIHLVRTMDRRIKSGDESEKRQVIMATRGLDPRVSF